MLSSQTTVILCILALKIAALSNVKRKHFVNLCVTLSTGNIASGKKEGTIRGYCKYREKPVETTTFPVGQVLALAMSSDGRILVSCSNRVSTIYLYVCLRLVVDRINWCVFGMQRHCRI